MLNFTFSMTFCRIMPQIHQKYSGVSLKALHPRRFKCSSEVEVGGLSRSFVKRHHGTFITRPVHCARAFFLHKVKFFTHLQSFWHHQRLTHRVSQQRLLYIICGRSISCRVKDNDTLYPYDLKVAALGYFQINLKSLREITEVLIMIFCTNLRNWYYLEFPH